MGLGIGVLLGLLLMSQVSNKSKSATPLPTGQITLTGRLLPSVNDDTYTWLGLIVATTAPSDDLRIAGYQQPFKYFLYDEQENVIPLSFTVEAIDSLRQQFLSSGGLNPLPTPQMWDEHPEYIATTALWQEWTGKWVSLTGKFDSSGTFEVRSLNPTDPPLFQSTSSRAKLVEITAFLDFPHGYDRVAPPIPIPYTFLDATSIDGTKYTVIVYNSNLSSLPRILSATNEEVYILASIKHWVKLKGWHLDPPRYSQSPDLIEVQSIQVISDPNVP